MPQHDLVYDFGMHRGEDTEFYLRKGFRVVAFEANPMLVEDCQTRFKDEIKSGRLKIVRGAIAPETAGDEIVFFINERSVWGSIDPSLRDRNAMLGFASREIRAKRVDVHKAFMDFGVPHYIKIDLEGADQVVLKEIARLEDRPDYISTEFPGNFHEFHASLHLLRRLGYRQFRCVQQATIAGSTGSITHLSGHVFQYRFPEEASGDFGVSLRGRWGTAAEAMTNYLIIYSLAAVFSQGRFLDKIPAGWRVRDFAYRVCGRPIPGWFDLHARR